MKVLWLTPVQFPPVTGAPAMAGGGWMEGWRWALEEFRPDVEVAILSQSESDHAPVTAGNATYHTLAQPLPASRGARIRQRWTHRYSVGQSGAGIVQRLVTELEPDLIHVHGSEHGLGTLAAASGVPYLISLQGIAAVFQHFMFSGLKTPDVATELLRPRFWKGHGYLHRYWTMRDRARTEARILADARFFLGNTEWDREVVGLVNPSARYFHGDRAMQRCFYSAEWRSDQADADVIYSTSGAAPYKGLETLLEAVAILRGAGVRPRVRIAAPMQTLDTWPVLRRIISRGRLQETVTFLGAIPADEIVAELQDAGVFVLPSHIENESNALIEAMLVGVPCVAAAVGGVPSVIDHGSEGLLYHDRDAYALAGALKTMLSDRGRAAELASRGRETAHRRHDPRHVAGQLADVYQSVIDESLRGPAGRAPA